LLKNSYRNLNNKMQYSSKKLFSSYSKEKLKKIELLKNSNLPIYIFGDSEYALVVKNFLNSNFINVKGNIISKGKNLYLNNEKINEFNFSYHIVVGIADETKAELIINQFELKNCISIDYFSLNPFYNLDDNIILESWSDIEFVLNNLSDANSKEIFYNYLKSALSFDNKLLKLTKPQYFPTFLNFTDKEIIVDGGAYIGDTLSEYIKFKRNFCEYHAFEPSLFNFNLLSEFSDGINNCFIYNKGLGQSNTILKFHDYNIQSSTSSFIPSLFNFNNFNEVEILRLDDVIDNVSFIKLDIEGAELDALMGATYLISKFKPKIAVCIYHKIEHLWQIHHLLKSIRSDYRFSLGYHSDSKILTELVLYAY
jgi:FkbM family methyltransferase